MKMRPACVPCLIRNTLDVARLGTSDESCQQEILQQVMAWMIEAAGNCPPPLAAGFIQKTVRDRTGTEDPYGPLKEKYNTMALELYPRLSAMKNRSENRFDAGVRLAVAGNIIDFGLASTLGRERLISTIDHAMSTRIKGRISDLQRAVAKAARILWIGDNAGEIVFDRLLLEEMDAGRVVYAVRGGPVQNDATMADAVAVGLTRMVDVIDSGAAIPGTLVEHCSGEFREVYDRADLIISKGQGNFETLDQKDPKIFFLFKAKCPVVAACGNWDLGDVVVKGPDINSNTDKG